MVMRGLGAVAIVAVGALVLAGCASAAPTKAGSRSVAGTSGGSSPVPLVSVGSPSPSDAAERSRVEAVSNLVRSLLADVVVALPDGSKEVPGLQVGGLPGPLYPPDDFIDVSDSWKAPGSADQVLAYIQHHVPASWTSEGSAGPKGATNVFYQAPAAAADGGPTVQVWVAPDPAGGVDLRVEVQDTWQPVRPALEQVPATVTGATLVRRTDLKESPSPPVTIHVGADIARHIAALLNALPSQAGGLLDAGGGPDTTITVTFDGDPSTTQYTVNGDIYNTVTVNAPSQELPTLSHAGDLVDYLEGFF